MIKQEYIKYGDERDYNDCGNKVFPTHVLSSRGLLIIFIVGIERRGNVEQLHYFPFRNFFFDIGAVIIDELEGQEVNRQHKYY